ncbi:MAG: cyclodeaminase/cyclohydrolase family protein [Clostridiales bacterium]|jgi:formiminotetrahydrofolate cyclodeaminase|nr:cyclodeaminase/cyclohydrolase family protein [Clostridiales bacterium]
MFVDDSSYLDMTLRDFLNALASKEPVPGGGGASALAGALAATLGCMVANLTIGKKKYAAVEVEVRQSLDKLTSHQTALMGLIDEDARVFGLLARAYSIPKTNPDRTRMMDAALVKANNPPAQMIEYACQVLDELEMLVKNGSSLAISDVGVAAVCCAAAINGAYLNLLINRKALSQTYLELEVEEAGFNKVTALKKAYSAKADRIMCDTIEHIRGD